MEGPSRENTSKPMTKNVGVFEGKVVAINPSKLELENLLGTTIDKDVNYVGSKVENGETIQTLRLSFWLQDVVGKTLKNISFFVENRPRVNRNGNKYQYVNQVGRTAWGEISQDGADLPKFFTKFTDKDKREIGDASYRKALIGEEEVMNFVRCWLGYDYFSPETNILLNWSKLFNGNYKELLDGLKSDLENTIVALATVRVVRDPHTDEIKEYQSIYNKEFLPGYAIKMFRSVRYTPEKIDILRTKENKKLQPHERFILNISDREYGCKDRYTLDTLKDYKAEEFFENSDRILEEDSSEY